MARNDNLLKSHIVNSTVFRDVSSTIQNELISSVGKVMIQEIKAELSKAPFVALIMNETSDINVPSQLSTVVRYVSAKGSVEKRFLHFTDVSSDRTANGLLQHALKVLGDLDCTGKLLAQTYNRAAVMALEHGGLQAKLRQHCKSATFIHCCAHKLNLVLSQSVSFIKQVKVFFTSLAFFGKSTKRTHALDQFVSRRLHYIAPTRWNFQSRIVETVNKHREDLQTLFESRIENNDSEWDFESIMCFPFKQHLQNLRDGFDQFWRRMDNFVSECMPPTKLLRLDSVSGENKKGKFLMRFWIL
ncbi:hypothetical protein ILUMI_06438 [Ignelater luminosus]|uniref:DUF4371 domain-containing protein n=1 Tax=Ignelater luminosus TaxID=2038154 RepID=A0A8K0DA96_IGNLU|nr:hypothetical protein ILUMI_06438 [Ignelater luminosus]